MIETQHKYILHDAFQPMAIEEQSVDLVVTSPPYPMVEMWDEMLGKYDKNIETALLDGMGMDAFEYMHRLLDRCWTSCYRVLKPGGFACINIGDATRTIDGRFRLYSNHSRVLQSCMALGFDVLPSILWCKPTNSPTKFMGSGMLPGGAYVTMEHEWILILRKGGKRVFNPEERQRRRESAIFWEERNKWFSDQWTDILGTTQKLGMKSDRKRSAAYPMEIPLRLISMYSMYGDVVLDPFSGTGTTALAAILSGRSSINIDIDQQMLIESSKLPSKRETKGILNNLLASRLSRHLQYVYAKDMLFFKYRNQGLGIPVKTQQEKELYLYPIKSISRSNDIIRAKYQKWKKSTLSRIITQE